MSVGIKETKEALIAANEIGLLALTRLKDGVQFNDFEAVYDKLVNDPDFKAKVLAGYENAKLIPQEVSDLSFFETLEVVKIQVGYAPKFVDALKKP